MTKFLTLFTALFIFIAAPVMAEVPEGIERDVTIKVDGMVCDFCAQSIKKVFGKQDAVKAVTVDLDAGEIVVDLKDGQSLNHAAMEKMVKDAGYTVTEIIHGETTEKVDE